MLVPGEAGLRPPELAGRLSCYVLQNPLMFRPLVLLAYWPMGLELFGLCFCTEPDEIRPLLYFP